MSLYTKYRPKDWDSVIGQEYITTILRNSIKSGRVSHAYLFHGSRGTGKTTSARILAKAINCTDVREGNPCHACANCRAFDDETMLDIIEIDAASNTGVDNIRELIERARFEPNQGKYKVYIIDEVHMLSTGAFNALLKTLEEPPSHVKFILATTEIEKVPETIRSRTLRFDFRKISIEDIITRLEYVCKTEGIQADGEALQIIAKSARGGLRDALTLLEQNMIDSEVTTEHVRHTLSLLEDEFIESIITELRRGNTATVLEIIDRLRERHVLPRSFFEQLMYKLRDLMMAHLDDGLFHVYHDLFAKIQDAYGKVRSIPDSMMLIEITLLALAKGEGNQAEMRDHEVKVEKSLPSTIVKESTKKEVKIEEKPPNELRAIVTEDTTSLRETPPGIISDTHTKVFSFPLFIENLKSTGLMSDVKTARFKIEEKKLTLIFPKKWNYDRVDKAIAKNSLVEVLMSTFGGEWSLECTLDAKSENSLSHAVNEIF